MGRSRHHASALRRAARVCTFVISQTVALNAAAYTPTLTQGGAVVRWGSTAKLLMLGNPTNQSGIPAEMLRQAAVSGLNRWKAASGGSVSFDYWQGTDPAHFEPNSNYNGVSSLVFTSNPSNPTQLPSNVIGMTQVWYNPDDGRVLEADVALNDRYFKFTSNPSQTSGFGSPNAGIRDVSGKPVIFMENVLTHELGHAYGLSHSGSLQSTMLFMEAPEQSYLACDDRVGIRAVYPSSDAGSRGSLTGRVGLPGSGAAVGGAHVTAVSRRRGVALASAVTHPNGAYRIDGLEPGEYVVIAEPYFAGPSALPTFYGGFNPLGQCPGGGPFGRTLLSDGTTPRLLSVSASQTTQAPELTVSCTNGGAPGLAALPGTGSRTTAPVVAQGSRVVGADAWPSTAGTRWYKLPQVQGHLEVRAMSYSLYSPAQVTITLTDANGATVAGAQSFSSTYTGSSGYTNYDSLVMADNLPAGDYYLRATGIILSSSQYPAGPLAVDEEIYLLLMGSVNEGAPALSSALPMNARCAAADSFGGYSSPAQLPPRFPYGDGSQIGFCGSVKRVADRAERLPHSGAPAPLLLGWALPWITMLAVARSAVLLARVRRRRLT